MKQIGWAVELLNAYDKPYSRPKFIRVPHMTPTIFRTEQHAKSQLAEYLPARVVEVYSMSPAEETT